MPRQTAFQIHHRSMHVNILHQHINTTQSIKAQAEAVSLVDHKAS